MIAPFYRFIDPVSTPMLWRWATGSRVERLSCRRTASRRRCRLPSSSPRTAPSVTTAASTSAPCARRCGNPASAASARGASTITQQTAKNLFLWQGRSYVRKALEIPLALWLNVVLPKRRILEIYLNIVELGPNGEFGAEAGARWAFGKSARDLNSHEAAELASILPNPYRRSARTPSFLVRRLAGLYERRSEEFPGRAACVKGP